MTEQELEILRLKMKIEALNILVGGLFATIARSSPTARKVLLEKLQSLKDQSEFLSLRNVPPEYSELATSEYRDALHDLIAFIEKAFTEIQ